MPAFGHEFLTDFPLAPGGVYLNHGTVGVTPRVVMQRRLAILDEIEAHPARFMLRELMHLDASTAATPSATVPRMRQAAGIDPGLQRRIGHRAPGPGGPTHGHDVISRASRDR